MFDKEVNNTIFEDNDEFGLQEYRLDSNYLFALNQTTVKLIKWNDNKSNTLQGDFLGVTLASEANLKDTEQLISINIMSTNPLEKEMTENGWNDRGVITYECYASWDLDINNKDIIEFISEYGSNIKRGERFRVKMDDSGLYQGQYTRKQFTLTKISNNPSYE